MKPLSALMGVVTGAMVTTFGMSGTANAADFSLNGTFAQDADVYQFDFSVATESTVTLRTYSYAGGTQADGTVVAAGGFDPVLTLFDGDGNKLFFNDDDNTNTVDRDPTTDKAYDSFLQGVLAMGNYTVTLTQYGNVSAGTTLADGFSRTGNFTGDVFSRCEAGSAFCDFTGNSRSNQWAFDALGVEPIQAPPVTEPPVTEPPVIEPPIVEPPVAPPTQVPEPATAATFVLMGLGALLHRRRQ